MHNGIEIYYDEVLCFGQSTQYRNFRYGGLVDVEDDGYNESTVSIEDGKVIRHYKHVIYIPVAIATEIIAAGDLNKQSSREKCNGFDNALYGYIRQTYYKQISIFISYLYEILMKNLMDNGFTPCTDVEFLTMQWSTDNDCDKSNLEDTNSYAANTAQFLFPHDVLLRFVGRTSKRGDETQPIGFQVSYPVAYIIHHMYITPNLMMQIFDAFGIENNVTDDTISVLYAKECELLPLAEMWKKSDMLEIRKIMFGYLQSDKIADIIDDLDGFDMDEDNNDGDLNGLADE